MLLLERASYHVGKFKTVRFQSLLSSLWFLGSLLATKGYAIGRQRLNEVSSFLRLFLGFLLIKSPSGSQGSARRPKHQPRDEKVTVRCPEMQATPHIVESMGGQKTMLGVPSTFSSQLCANDYYANSLHPKT